MIQRIRHWLRLPLLTTRERRNLNGFWMMSVVDIKRIPSREREVRYEMAEEFANTMNWIEELKA